MNTYSAERIIDDQVLLTTHLETLHRQLHRLVKRETPDDITHNNETARKKTEPRIVLRTDPPITSNTTTAIIIQIHCFEEIDETGRNFSPSECTSYPLYPCSYDEESHCGGVSFPSCCSRGSVFACLSSGPRGSFS